jgi:GTP-binding protein
MAHRLPTVVIVGRPNVGKSTLFNRIAGKRIAVVQDTPGVTRDRLYAEAEFRKRVFRIVDTGGILFSDADPLIEQIRVQAQVAIAEADLILFMVDVEHGPTPADWELAHSLRMLDLPIYLVANKADNPARELESHEFTALGFGEVYPVSAIHGRGVDGLMEMVVDGFPKSKGEEEPEEELRLAIVGRPNVGKSSMLNALIGGERAIVSSIAGTTRDAIDTKVKYKGRDLRLIDTAGIRRRGKIQGSIEYYMVLRAERALQRAECALIVVDGEEGMTDGDKRVAKSAHDMGKPVVIAVNKWDLREPPAGNLGKTSPLKKDFKRSIMLEMPEIDYAPILFTSAKEHTGMEGIMNAVFRAVENWNFRIGTGVLNRLIQDAMFAKPLSRHGNVIRVYYATQAETKPPTFVLFSNKPDLLHFSYVRYLENQIREKFPLEGTPIRVVVRSSRETGENE